MTSIITLTFNPALDKSVAIAKMVPDKKLKCLNPVIEPGGGGINVARAIKKLGGNATAIFLSGGDTGKKVGELLKEEKIDSIAIDLKECTRENLIIADLANNRQYLFDMPGPHVSQPEWQASLDALIAIPDISYIIVSGSLPDGVPADIFFQISSIARNKNAKLVVDTSGEALKKASQTKLYLMKLNIRELASLDDKEELNIVEIPLVARRVIENGNCEALVISMGPFGAMLVTKELALTVKPPNVHTESTVGAGDSLVAGLVLSLDQGKTLIEAVQYGVACGSAATLRAGTELCVKEDAENLYQIIKNNTYTRELIFNENS